MSLCLRQLMLIALLLAFAAQLVAAAQPCAMASGMATDMAPGAMDHAAHAMVDGDHSQHAMDPTPERGSPLAVCCDLGIDCDMSQCGFAVGLVQQFNNLPITSVLPAAMATHNNPLTFFADPLYHPPRLA